MLYTYNYKRDSEVKRLDFDLSIPIYTTTLLNKQNGRIYAFRINNNNNDSKQIVFTDIATYKVTPTTSTNIENNDESEGSDFSLTSTLAVIIGIVITGIICVVCTIAIGLYVIKRIQKGANGNSSQQNENLIQIKSDSEYDDESGSVEMNETKTTSNKSKQRAILASVMDGLSDAKIDQLYEIYSRSKLQCFQKCEDLGLTDEHIEELIALFERYKAI